MSPSANLKARLSGKGFSHKSALDTRNFKDVRDKLILKKRLSMKDARDKIVEKTRAKDARSKLNFIRKVEVPKKSDKIAGKRKPIRTNAGRSNVKVTGTPAQLAIRTPKHGGVVAQRRDIKKTIPPKYQGKVHTVARYAEKRSIQSTRAPVKKPAQKNQISRDRPALRAPPQKKKPSLTQSTRGSRYGVVHRRASRYVDLHHTPKLRPLYDDEIYDPQPSPVELTRMYKLQRSDYYEDPVIFTDEERSPPRKIASHMDYLPHERESYSTSTAYPSRYLDDLDDIEMRDLAEPVDSFMTRRAASDPTDYKLVVSNLDHQVTEDELFSLFSSVGSVYDCKFIRLGVAELHYIKESDAMAGFEAFNRRTLDNKPMNVKFVDKRISDRGASYSSRQVLNYGDKRKTFRSPSDQGLRPSRRHIEPDVGTIHQALFRESRPISSSLVPKRRYL